MKEIKFKYCKNSIRLWLFKAVLFFSVFSFSGFNLQIHSAFNESVKTELVESRILKPVYRLKKNTKKFKKILLTSPLSDVKSFNIWALLNDNNVLKIKFKSYRNRILLYSFTSIKILFKIPSSSSEDETLPLSTS